MNFIRYNPNTGEITEAGYMSDQFVQAEIDAGQPTMFYDGYIELGRWRVNLQTKELEPIQV